MSWTTPKTDWNSTQQGVTDTDFNRIEGNIEYLGRGRPLIDVDGNVYPTVNLMGLSITAVDWRATKLNDGTAIPLVSDASSWAALSTFGRCVYGGNFSAFGQLYNGYALDGLAPDGWRVMTNTDWDNLMFALGTAGYTHDFTTGGATGDKLAKSLADRLDWQGATPPDGSPAYAPGSNNMTGVSLKPNGYRDDSGTFIGFFGTGAIWTPTATLSSYSLGSINGTNVNASRATVDVKYGVAVRMVRDL